MCSACERDTAGETTRPAESPSPAAREPEAELTRLLEIVARLRGPGGCPWDREQTLESLKPFLIEECYEVLDAIDSGDDGHLAEELGDVLLQVALQSRICEERGSFAFGDVVRLLSDKLVRRHPHVFGDVEAGDTDAVLRNWEAIKSREKRSGRALLEGIPRHLPALMKAHRVQQRASRVGFDWACARDVIAKIDEELAELREAVAGGDERQVTEELGDVLFSAVNLGRFLGIGSEEALHGTIDKFMTRFGAVEAAVAAAGRVLNECTLEELDAHWEAAKRREREASPSAVGGAGAGEARGDEKK